MHPIYIDAFAKLSGCKTYGIPQGLYAESNKRWRARIRTWQTNRDYAYRTCAVRTACGIHKPRFELSFTSTRRGAGRKRTMQNQETNDLSLVQVIVRDGRADPA